MFLFLENMTVGIPKSFYFVVHLLLTNPRYLFFVTQGCFLVFWQVLNVPVSDKHFCRHRKTTKSQAMLNSLVLLAFFIKRGIQGQGNVK